MYNLQNLNDNEFEILCSDMLRIIHNKEFETYARGKDGGIDIRSEDNEIIAQCKHYRKTPKSTFLKKILDELPKLKAIKYNFNYYIITSLELTPNDKDNIFKLFKDYMTDNGNIISGIDINKYLSKKEFTYVIEKNYKLWIPSINIINTLIRKDLISDSNTYISKIQERSKIYVKTSYFSESLKILNNHNILLITGSPGVGKTTLSEMLIAKYLNDGYSFRYSSTNDIKGLKNLVNFETDNKEIILLDDFLGHIYLELKQNFISEIQNFISTINRSKNKKLILNSRITILNSAELDYEFNCNNLIRLQFEKLNDLEKAKIFYNHLYFSKIEEAYFEEIRRNRNYLKIVNHKNFNPRIIEYVTNHYQNCVNPNEYTNFILNSLDFPNDIWKKEIQKYDITDRNLLYIMQSISNDGIEYELLKKAFESYITKEKNLPIDYTLYDYNDMLNRLNKSIILIYELNSKRYIKPSNPSINDYLYNDLKLNNLLKNKLQYSAILVDQIIKLEEMGTKIDKDIILNDAFLEMNYIDMSSGQYFLKYISKNNIISNKIKNYVWKALMYKDKNAYGYDFWKTIIKFLFSHEVFKFYNLNKLFEEDYLLQFSNKLDYKSLILLTNCLNNLEIDTLVYLHIKSFLITELKNKMVSELIIKLNYNMFDYIDKVYQHFNIDDEYLLGINTEKECERVARAVIKKEMPKFDDLYLKQMLNEILDFLNIGSCVENYLIIKNENSTENKKNKNKIVDYNELIDSLFVRI